MAGYSGVFISAMLCRAARGGLLSRNALCRGPSIAPTANIPQPGPNPQPRRPVAAPGLRRARCAGGEGHEGSVARLTRRRPAS